MALVDPFIGFGDSVYLEAAQLQYGSRASLWPNPGHAYQWHAKMPNNEQKYPISLQAWSDAKYGPNWRIVLAEGVDKYAWRWLNPYNPDPTKTIDWAVLPVVFVSADWIWDIPKVSAAAAKFAHNLTRVSDWFGSQLGGKKLKICRPQIVPDYRTSQQVWDLYQASKTHDGMTPAQYDEARYKPWRTAIADYSNYMGKRVNSNVIYAYTHFAGPSADWDFAAAGGGPHLFVSSFATVYSLPDLLTVSDPRLQTLGYAITHEGGHCLGLGHTDSQFADDWQKSIMQASKPPQAILCDYERARLKNSPFFV